MNLRDIKKDIEYVLSAFVEDCMVSAAAKPKHQKAIGALVDEAVVLFDEFRARAATKVAKKAVKAYFSDLSKDVLQQTNALWGRLSELVATDEPDVVEEEVPVKKAPKKLGNVKKAAPKAEEAPAKKPAKKAEEAPKAVEAPAEKPVKKAPAKKAAPKAEEAPAEKPVKKAPAKKAAPKAEKAEGEAEKKPAAKKAPAKKAAPKAEEAPKAE